MSPGRRGRASSPSRAIGLGLAFQLLFTYTPPMQFLFETEPLDALTWVRIVIVASSVFFLVELEKTLVRARSARLRPAPA